MRRITGILIVCLICFLAGADTESKSKTSRIHTKTIAAAEQLIGMEFTEANRKLMLEDLQDLQKNYENIRKVPLDNSVLPSVLFNPIPPGFAFEKDRRPFRLESIRGIDLPANYEELAFYSVHQLSELIKGRKISSEQLTLFFLQRLKTYGPKLECVVTLTEERALMQARRADQEIASGKYRGPLHGIPYGAKDLLATKGVPTTWGTAPYKTQTFEEDAEVVKRLEDAGAVLVAKLTLGELAWGDVWFGGRTRNPWNLQQGSSGSSAGSASATAAGLVPFAIGSETWGSIVSPSSRCGVTGLRPTYGRVSRRGAMALSWSMDKLGPLCRHVEDCAIIFQAIQGPDGVDPTLYDVPFNYGDGIDLQNLKVAYLKKDFDKPDEAPKDPDDINDETMENDRTTLDKLQEMGVKLIPVELPKLPINDLAIILSAESAAAFDELTRSKRIDQMKRQERYAWPNSFRESRLIPAVEYLQANRVRTLLIQEMDRMMKGIDILIAPSFKGDSSLLTNLTGHPCVVVPNGFKANGTPTSITFIGGLFQEATILAFAKEFQDATEFHLKHPKL